MRTSISRQTCQSGFGLAEVMVALAIGLITTLVIMQVMINFEGQKRTTGGGADAQTNGAIALYSIQRRMQMAGFGLPVFSEQNQPLDCTDVAFDHDNNPATPNLEPDLFPVTITDGGGGASDTISVRVGPTQMGGIPVVLLNVDASDNSVGVANNLMCADGDIVLAVDGSVCRMSRVVDLPGPDRINLESAADMNVGASFTCLGNWTETVYQVNANNLTENGVVSVAGIVSLQAQYGVADSPSGHTVDAWVDATGSWVAPTVENRKRIKAVRVAVVARSAAVEATNVTDACSSRTAASPTGLCAWEGTEANPAPALDLSAEANWRRYRYRVFETIIPLRNMIWSGGTL